MYRFVSLSLSVVFAALLLSASPAFAQHDASWKALGQHGQTHQAFSRRVTHAADYARDLTAHVTRPVKPAVAAYKPTPAAVKEVYTELGRNLDAAQTHLTAMKKAAGDDKATLESITKIETHLTAAFAHHKEAHACCVEDFDEAKAMTCCKDLSKELDQVVAEHAALMKTLSTKKPAVTKSDK